ncbi:MAG: carbon-nitrogen hydrolase family protein [Planctomycetota bacterium]|jgi:predicted amidohydrolase
MAGQRAREFFNAWCIILVLSVFLLLLSACANIKNASCYGEASGKEAAVPESSSNVVRAGQPRAKTMAGNMKSFKLAIVQHNSNVGDKGGNLTQVISWTRKAKKAGTKLVLFPELNITGHAGDKAMVRHAEAVPGGPSVERLTKLANELDIYICAGICEDDHYIHYNTQFIVGPEGYIGKQRKVHLSGDEYFYFRGGTALPVFDLPFARIGIIICYDNLFPEISRCLAVKGAEVLLCPHAARFGDWPEDAAGRYKAVESRKQRWRLTQSCRAFDNACFVALCDTAGRSAMNISGVEANHAGGCMVVNPRGKVIAESHSKDIQDEMVVVELDAKVISQRRSSVGLNLHRRRPEVFKVLSEPTL